MFLIHGIESEEFEVAARHYGLEANLDDDTSEIRLDDFVLKKFNDWSKQSKNYLSGTVSTIVELILFFTIWVLVSVNLLLSSFRKSRLHKFAKGPGG